jgi:hypothetical protein
VFGHVQGLDPETVAGQRQAAAGRLEQGEREETVEARQRRRPPGCERLEDRLGVPLTVKAAAIEFPPEVGVVEDLPVVDER